MTKRLLKIAQYFVFLAAGIGLVWWQLKDMSPGEKQDFSSALSDVHFEIIIPVVIMSLLSHASRAMRWQILMEPLGYKPSFKNAFSVTMIGYLANAAVPRLGEVLKCTFLAKYERLRMDRLFGTIVVERMFDFLCFLLFIFITIIIQFGIISGFLAGIFSGYDGTPLLIRLALLILMFAGTYFSFRFLFRKFPQHGIVVKLRNILRGLRDGLKTIFTLKRKRAFLLHTFFIWAMYLLQVYVGFRAMDGTAHLGMPAAFSVLTLATIAMIVTPGGIGSFPVFVMETLLIYGISSPIGKAFGWLQWGVNTGIIIIFGFAALLLLPVINKRNEDNKGHSIEDLPSSTTSAGNNQVETQK